MTREAFLTIAACLCASSGVAATVDGSGIHYTVRGSGDRTLVFVHGWTCNESSWQQQVPAFAHEYRVITLDLPGHGRTGIPARGELSVPLFARAVEAVRADLRVERMVLVGHSMGAPVIRQYARMHPSHVEALVLVDGLVQLVEDPPRSRPNVTGSAGLKTREAIIRGFFSAATGAALQTRIRSMMLSAPESTAEGAMRATWDRAHWSDEPVTVPTLGIYAERSPFANRQGLRRLYPDLEYHEMAGTGHFLMMEKPVPFNRLLGRFLARLPWSHARPSASLR